MFPVGTLITILNYITLHYPTLHYTALRYTTLHYSTVHYSTLHYAILHSTTPYYTTINYTDTPELFPRENNRDNPFIARQLQSTGRFRAMRWTHRALLLRCHQKTLLVILLRRLRGKWKQLQDGEGMRGHVPCVWAGVRRLLQIRQVDGRERVPLLPMPRTVQGQFSCDYCKIAELPGVALKNGRNCKNV